MGKKSSSYNYHNPESFPSTGDDGGCCSVSCLRLSLYVFNAVFFLTGLVLVGVGLWTVLEKHPSLMLLTSGLYEMIGYVIVVAGRFSEALTARRRELYLEIYVLVIEAISFPTNLTPTYYSLNALSRS